jgi:hypothetical protein
LVALSVKSADKDLGFRYLLSPEAFATLAEGGSLSLRGNLTRNLYELSLWTVAAYSLGYYRLYRDGGAARQPLFAAVGGGAKIVAACLFFSWYVQGHATRWMLLAIAPEAFLGLYFVKAWWDAGAAWTDRAVGGGDDAPRKQPDFKNPSVAPRNWVFGLAAAHAILLSFPSFLLSVTGVRIRCREMGST